MKLFRIASRRHKIFSGTGAALCGARWNSIGTPVIYAATSLAGAKLELLAHIGFAALPKGYAYVEIDVPDALPLTRYRGKAIPAEKTSKQWGDRFIRSGKCAVALVPSAASPGEYNALINPEHPDFNRIKVSAERVAKWDARHFRVPRPAMRPK